MSEVTAGSNVLDLKLTAKDMHDIHEKYVYLVL